MRFGIVLIWVCTFSNWGYGQVPLSFTFSGVRSEGRSIPDPKSVMKSFGLLRNAAIVNDIGLSDTQVEKVRTVLDECHGEPAIFIAPDGFAEIDRDGTIATTLLSEREQDLASLLSDEQKARLSQIVYQTEIQRVGYKDAILNGFLGADAGLDDATKASLAPLLEKIESEVIAKQSQSVKSLNNEVLAILTREQRKTMEQTLGKPMRFKPNTFIRKRIVPNPNELAECTSLIELPGVKDELGISDRQKLMQKVSPSALTLGQSIRLKELAHQYELERRELATSLAKGFLGSSLELDAKQKLRISEILERFQDSNNLDKELRSQFFGKLKQEHSHKMEVLLGRFFDAQNPE